MPKKDINFDNQAVWHRREIFLYIFTNEALLIEMLLECSGRPIEVAACRTRTLRPAPSPPQKMMKGPLDEPPHMNALMREETMKCVYLSTFQLKGSVVSIKTRQKPYAILLFSGQTKYLTQRRHIFINDDCISEPAPKCQQLATAKGMHIILFSWNALS